MIIFEKISFYGKVVMILGRIFFAEREGVPNLQVGADKLVS